MGGQGLGVLIEMTWTGSTKKKRAGERKRCGNETSETVETRSGSPQRKFAVKPLTPYKQCVYDWGMTNTNAQPFTVKFAETGPWQVLGQYDTRTEAIDAAKACTSDKECTTTVVGPLTKVNWWGPSPIVLARFTAR